MTDEQKIFIRGVEGRGDEVIKTLTDLGAKNRYGLEGDNTRTLYFITHDGTVGSAIDDDEPADIVREYCHEVKLPEKWQDGDVLINLDGDTFVVFCHDVPNFSFRACLQVNESVCQEYSSGLFCYRNNYRLATPAEVDKFQDMLGKKGKRWNPETKKLENAVTGFGRLYVQEWDVENAKEATMEQLPDYDTLYFYITSVGDVQAAVVKKIIDRTRFRIGNFFHTREEANGMSEKIKKLLKGE